MATVDGKERLTVIVHRRQNVPRYQNDIKDLSNSYKDDDDDDDDDDDVVY